MKKKIWIIAAVIAILGIVPVSLKAQESTPRVVSTEAELEKAIKDKVSSVKLGKDITIGGTSTDEPFIIDSDIVIDGDGNSLALRKSGIVLGGDVTFKKMNLTFESFVRNAIIANGYSLTMEDVKNGSSGGNSQPVNIDLFCGQLTGYENNAVKLPSAGKKSEILLMGDLAVSNIFAGNFSEKKEANQANQSNIPVTITVKSDEKKAIETICGFGAVEDRSGSTGGNFTGNSYSGNDKDYPTNSDIKVILEGVSQTTVGEIFGKTGSDKGISVEYKGGEYPTTLNLNDISELKVTSGNLVLSSSSNLTDEEMNISIGKDAVLDLNTLESNVTVSDLDSEGSLILDKKQTLTIKGKVTGQTTVYAEGQYNNQSTGDYDSSNIYIKSNNSDKDSFLFAKPQSGSENIPKLNSDGTWSVKEQKQEDPNTPPASGDNPGQGSDGKDEEDNKDEEDKEDNKQEEVLKDTEIEKPKAESSYKYTGYDIVVIPSHKGYILKGNQGKDVGSYLVTVTPKKGYAWVGGGKEELNYTWNIQPLTLTLQDAQIKDKYYDNTTKAQVAKLVLLDQDGQQFSGNTITVNAEFADTNVGEDKKVTVKIATKDPNLTIVQDTIEVTGNILKQNVQGNDKIKPKGEPSYTEITSEGKTLADANLEKGSITTEGKISWVFPDSTKVEPNKDYAWVFTPSDLNKYQIISGRVVLYKVEVKEEETDKKPTQGGSTSGNTTGGNQNTGQTQKPDTGGSTGNNQNNQNNQNQGTGNGSVSNNTSNNNTNNTVSNNTTNNNTNNTVSSNNTVSNNNTVSDNKTDKKPESSNNKKPQTVSDNRTEQQKLQDNIKDKTTASLTNNKTVKKEDIRLEIRGTYPENKVSKELRNQGIQSVEEIEEKLKTAIRNHNPEFSESENNLYDVSLIYTKDYGATWNKGNKNNFPSDGYLKVSIPVPGQINPDNYDFAVAHMFTNNDFGKVPGEIEIPAVTERTDSYGIHYLDFYVTGLSPIMVSWKESSDSAASMEVDSQEILSENENGQQEDVSLQEGETSVEGEQEQQELSKEAKIKLGLFIAGSLIFLILVLWIAKKIAWG